MSSLKKTKASWGFGGGRWWSLKIDGKDAGYIKGLFDAEGKASFYIHANEPVGVGPGTKRVFGTLAAAMGGLKELCL